MKKMCFTALLLVVTGIFTVSCSERAGQQDDNQTVSEVSGNQSVTGKSDDTRAYLEDGLPKKNYNKQEFNMLIRSEFFYEFDISSQSGDIVDDAVYKRNLAVEERFNINLNVIQIDGSWEKQDVFKNALMKSILAGDGEYDLVAGASNYISVMAGDGIFLNLSKVPYIDFDKPWWSDGFSENMSIGDAQYLATGDIAISTMDNMCVMFFNKKLMDDYNFAYPYDSVLDGTWTFEKMKNLSVNVSDDINGDGKFTAEDDLFGFMTYPNMNRSFPTSFAIPIVDKDDKGLPKIAFMSERLTNAFDMVRSFIINEQSSINYTTVTSTHDVEKNMQTIFSESRAMFMAQVVSCVENLRDMEVDFGIVPYPKYDENQDRYYTTVLVNVTCVVIPATVKDAEMSGLITEALASEGYNGVVPAYYDMALKIKNTRDVESGKMIDIIRDSTWYDFGYINNTSLSGIGALFGIQVTSADGNIVSAFESNRIAYQASLDKLVENYLKNMGTN